jgi:hypothetical protein
VLGSPGPASGMGAPDDPIARNVQHVERFLACFDGRWPTEDELATLLAGDVRFVERPNLVNPAGGERDWGGMRAGIEAGRRLLAGSATRSAITSRAVTSS